MTAKAKEPERPARVERSPDPVDPPPAEPKPPAGRKVAEGMCVVDDGTGHYADGRALPGASICSAHEMHYHRDGTSRAANPRG